MVAIMAVEAVPPSESCRRRVSLLSRYGTCGDDGSASAAMTFPNADRLVLMLFASDNRVPFEIVLRTLSDPTEGNSIRMKTTNSRRKVLLLSCITQKNRLDSYSPARSTIRSLDLTVRAHITAAVGSAGSCDEESAASSVRCCILTVRIV